MCKLAGPIRFNKFLFVRAVAIQGKLKRGNKLIATDSIFNDHNATKKLSSK